LAYVSTDYADSDGDVVGDGQCVAYVKEVAGCPATSLWKPGANVKGATDTASGTAIAVFQNGHYTNVSGSAHAAIYVSQDSIGLWVYDQWSGQAVHRRQIRFDDTNHGASNNGNVFQIIT
jgi:hypothetical protein